MTNISSELPASIAAKSTIAEAPFGAPDTLPPTTVSPPFDCHPVPGETPRAFSAFLAFFQLGHARSLQGVADQLGENPATIKNWSSKFRWSDRIHAFNSGLLQQQAEAQAALHRQHSADWARRTREYREQEWAAAQKLLVAVQCFLESFGDREVEKMTLSQVSRALQISSRIARMALSGNTGLEERIETPLETELAAALKRAYSQPSPMGTDLDPSGKPVSSSPNTNN
jgi:hypothetical protein